MTARLLNCTDAEYFSDPASVPSLSASIAKTLLMKSPQHAWLEHPRLGGQRTKPTAAMDEGQLVHTLLLGKGTEVIVIDADNFRTKAAQEARDIAIRNGQLPVIREKYDEALIAVEKIRRNIAAFGISLDGASEVAIEWTEDGILGDPVVCRCKMDHVWLDDGRILDIKKAESAHPKAAARAVANYGYAMQAVAYTRALEALNPDLKGRVQFGFLFVENEPPYAVLPAWLSGTFKDIGERQWARAVRLWENCLANNRWPGYATEPVALEAPVWALAEEELASGAE